MRYLLLALPFLVGCAAFQGWWQSGGEETVRQGAEVATQAAGFLPPPWDTVARWAIAITVGGAATVGGVKTVDKLKKSEPGKLFG